MYNHLLPAIFVSLLAENAHFFYFYYKVETCFFSSSFTSLEKEKNTLLLMKL